MSFVVIYLSTECLKDKKKQVGIDVCIVPVTTTMFAGILSFYTNYISDSSPFFAFQNANTHLSLSSEFTGILSFLTLHIAACVGWVTFWAFWSQINANALIVKNFKEEQITDQYSRLLDVHRENIKDLKILSRNDVILEGGDALDCAQEEYEYLYEKVKDEIIILILGVSENDQSRMNNEAHEKYFSLIDNKERIILKPSLDNIDNFKLWFDLQRNILQVTYYFFYEGFDYNKNKPEVSTYLSEEDCFNIKWMEDIKPKFRNKLTNYYRNIFYAVKYVVYQNDELFEENQKKAKLKMLRAQMNNTEQLMLFYNWFSGYGCQWENNHLEEKGNSFLTKHKMIHNLNYKDLNKTIFSDFACKNDFESQKEENNLKKEILLNLFNNLDFFFGKGDEFNLYVKCKSELYPLFEFEDWD